MKVEVKKIDATKRELRFEVPRERVLKKLNEVYSEIGKEAQIQGFRPGKAPRHVLESRYSKLAQDEVVKKLIPEVYQEAVTENSLSPIDLPEIDDVSFKDGVVSFTAKLDIKPDVKIKSYKGLKVTKKNSQVNDEEIEKAIDIFKKSQAQGKEIPIDDTFARSLGYANLEDFKSSLKRQLEIDKDRHNRMDIEQQVIDHLLKNTTLAVPESAVNRQLEHLLEDTKQRLRTQGIPEEDITKREGEMREDLKKNAERDIKIYFILDKIAELENMTIEKGENLFHKIIGFLLKEADWKEPEGGK